MSDSNYILGKVIARGGMAEVSRGLQVGQDGFKRIVAIKRILPQFANHKEFIEMFRDEAHIGQRLQHTNIVKVECYDVVEGLPSIVMEFIDGSDLRSILAEIEKSKDVRRMPIPLALYIIAEAARGLHYAHTRRDDVSGRPLDIVHRDISPQNLLVSFNGEVKVTDFGIAAADRNFKNTETRAGIVKGKYSYMSPEQISAKKVDARADVFALSIVMWEMIAMRRLFSADNEVDVIDMVKHCKIPGRLKEFNSEVASDLELIVMRGLAKDPQKRFASMDELERALRSHLSKEFQNFNVQDLGNMIKQVLTNKHDASQAEIKRMLTSTNLRPTAAKSTSIVLELDAGNLKTPVRNELTVSRLTGATGSRNFNSQVSQKSGRAAVKLGSSQTQNSRKQSHRSPAKLHIWVATFIIGFSIAIFLRVQSMNAAKDAIIMTLRSMPTNVRIKVNGQAVAGGRYLLTPTRLKLETGTNLVEIVRNGYQSETLSVDTTRGEHRQVSNVKLNPKQAFALTRFMLAGNSTVQLNVNDGFAVSTLSPSHMIFDVRDLSDGVPAEVLISEKGKQSYRCKILPMKSSDRKPYIITIDPDRNSCQTRSLKERSGP